MSHYDYIILGAGAAGLMLANAMGQDSFFEDKSILILEKGTKTKNDRTWCFWENGVGDFDSIVHKKWSKIYVAGDELQLNTPIAPYSYKMIRGIDFYTHFGAQVKSYPNISWVKDTVIDFQEGLDKVVVKTKSGSFTGTVLFNSIFDPNPLKEQKKFPVLQQHFLGWFIKTEKPTFDAETATFMDFSIPQNGNTRFMYVLPFSETEALVEYTLFSEKLLEQSKYEEAIKIYIEEKFKVPCKIMETEFGSIPMTCYPFHKNNSERILHIGTAGGWTKASTGFTFYNTYKKVDALVNHLKQEKPLTQFHSKSRFHYYDLLLLDILYRDNSKGRSIFESMFKKQSASLILKFLDNETTFWEDLKIISACPKKPFLKALWDILF